MAFTYAVGATRALSKAIPVIKNSNNKVKKWELSIVYNCNNVATDFNKEIDVEYLNKEVNDFTKEELLGLCNLVHLDMVFDSFYQSMTTEPAETKLNDFDITSLN